MPRAIQAQTRHTVAVRLEQPDFEVLQRVADDQAMKPGTLAQQLIHDFAERQRKAKKAQGLKALSKLNEIASGLTEPLPNAVEVIREMRDERGEESAR